MPELPDIETFRGYVQATSMHQKIKDVEIFDRRILDGVPPRQLTDVLRGKAFEETCRHGKHLLVRVGDTDTHWLILHFGMTGRLEYGRNREKHEHDRVIFDFSGDKSLAYVSRRRLGRIGLTASVDRFIEEAELGPDAMAIGEEEFRSQIMRGSKAKIKSVLMNQKLLAGIGNIYSDEILFHARVPPHMPARDLDDSRIRQLYRAMRRVLNTAVEREADPKRVPRTWLLPDRQPGRPCPRCHTKIRESKLAGRSALWCPNCQTV